MNREQKAVAIEEVTTQIRESEAVFAVDYRGLSVKQAMDLRQRLTEADASFRVVKNSLTERAADQAGTPGLKTLLQGPTAFAFVRGDAAVAAKALAGFRRETQLLEFKGGTLGGDVLTPEQVDSIARLPSRDVLQGQFVGVLASPITGLVRGLGALISGLAVALGQIQEKGLVSGEAAPVEATEPAPAEEAAAPPVESAAAASDAAEAVQAAETVEATPEAPSTEPPAPPTDTETEAPPDAGASTEEEN